MKGKFAKANRKVAVVKRRGQVKKLSSAKQKEYLKEKRKKQIVDDRDRKKEQNALKATIANFAAEDSVDTNRHIFIDRYLPDQYGLLRRAISILKNGETGAWSVRIEGVLIYCTKEILVSVAKGHPRFTDKSRKSLFDTITNNFNWMNPNSCSNFPWHPRQLDHMRICLLEYDKMWDLPDMNGKKKKVLIKGPFIASELKKNDPIFVDRTEKAIYKRLMEIRNEESICTRSFDTETRLLIEQISAKEREMSNDSMTALPAVKPASNDNDVSASHQKKQQMKKDPNIPFFGVLLKWFLDLDPEIYEKDGVPKPPAVEGHHSNTDALSSDVENDHKLCSDASLSDVAFGTADSSAMPPLTENPFSELDDMLRQMKNDPDTSWSDVAFGTADSSAMPSLTENPFSELDALSSDVENDPDTSSNDVAFGTADSSEVYYQWLSAFLLSSLLGGVVPPFLLEYRFLPPLSVHPTEIPSFAPTISNEPSNKPSSRPTFIGSAPPTISPAPSKAPTKFPSHSPTTVPSGFPSSSQTSVPTSSPSTHPSVGPSPSRDTANSILDSLSMSYFTQAQKDEVKRRIGIGQKRHWKRLSPEARQQRILALQGHELLLH